MRIAFIALALAVVVLEAAVYVVVGRMIGILPTLGLGLLSMVAGTWLLRRQGIAALARMRVEAGAGRIPAAALLEGAVLAAAALLMILPGFITDTVGALLFIPGVRHWLGRHIRERMALRMRRRDGSGGASPTMVELDRSQYVAEPRPNSPWRQDGPER